MTEPKTLVEAIERISELYVKNSQLLNEGSPEFLKRDRDKAFNAFLEMGIPSRKMENYKYTDLQKTFDQENFNRCFSPPPFNFDMREVFSCDVPEFDTHLLFLVNGWYYDQNQISQLPEGLVIKSLKKALVENPDLVEKHYARIANSESDPLAALNSSFAQDGIFIYLPDNLVVEKPVQIINILSGEEDLYVTQRNLMVVGKNAQVKLMFCDHTLSRQNFIVNNLTEVDISEDSVVDIYGIQNQHNGTVNLNSLFVRQKNNSHLITSTISLHGGLIRNNLNVDLIGEHASTSLFGLALTDRDQHVDNFTFVQHSEPSCTSNQIYKNILDDTSTGAFTGRIHVAPGAKKTQAYQRNNSVLLTKASKMNTKPQLVIDNDDVKCSHGATVGQVNEEALFYLQARGINEKEARLMLMFAFAHEVLANIRVEPLRQSIDHLVNKRLRGEVSRCHDCKLECTR